MNLTKQEEEQVKTCVRKIERYLLTTEPLREEMRYKIIDPIYDIAFRIYANNEGAGNLANLSIGYACFLFEEKDQDKWIGNMPSQAIKVINEWANIKEALIEKIKENNEKINSIMNFSI